MQLGPQQHVGVSVVVFWDVCSRIVFAVQAKAALDNMVLTMASDLARHQVSPVARTTDRPTYHIETLRSVCHVHGLMIELTRSAQQLCVCVCVCVYLCVPTPDSGRRRKPGVRGLFLGVVLVSANTAKIQLPW